jgi:hypothetical protein
MSTADDSAGLSSSPDPASDVELESGTESKSHLDFVEKDNLGL